MKYWFRYGDLYRIGGDEFIVVVPNIDKEQLDTIVKQWYQLLAPLNAQYNDDFICDLSYGVYYKSGSDTASFEDIMNNADKQMYTMKRDIKAQRGEDQDKEIIGTIITYTRGINHFRQNIQRDSSAYFYFSKIFLKNLVTKLVLVRLTYESQRREVR